MTEQLWNDYFSGDYVKVFNESNKILTDFDAADNLHLSGLALLALDKYAEGIGRLRASLALCPMMKQWAANASIMALKAGEVADALQFAKDGLIYSPNDAVLHFSVGNALMAQYDHDGAAAAFRTALGLDPEFIDAKLNLGNCLHRLDDADGALKCYGEIITTIPEHEAANINRAGILFERGQDSEAAAILATVSNKTPEVAFMLAMLRLVEGRYEEGWELYRKRWTCPMAKPDLALVRKPFADSLAQIKGKHVLLFAEQGFGDSLQFVRYLPMLIPQVGKLTLLIPKELKRLFARIDPFVKIVHTRDEADSYDFEIPMMDSPFLFKTTLDTIPNKPYFTVPQDVANKHKLPKKVKKLRVGLCWSGMRRSNPDLAAVDRRRSMSLELFAPIINAAPDDIEFFSLQYGENDLPNNIATPLKTGFDFLDTAAIVQQLDLVITVDTAVAHLVGGLGVPVWVFSRFDGCWRWLRGRQDSPWYPSLYLFNQTKPGSWEEPITELVAALRSKLDGA